MMASALGSSIHHDPSLSNPSLDLDIDVAFKLRGPSTIALTNLSCSTQVIAESQRKKGNTLDIGLIETRKRYYDDAVEAAPAAEHGGNCKCGTSCACVDCTCGN
ncbi:hypothetical protein HHK36_005341 [Tetracentron sinense]|uniref:Metallothionein-like protein n=1 Tax=Tetracentron sinense TaxID=13715 RepID=A0A834ZVA2_TETSI|nr:hypothetical protein HHK36_005319 [Tetracentron sinense]KAF8409267.1 hypothetical protein HHK36_005341 [Tetracentron sinense]